MQDQQSNRRIPLGIAAGVSAVALTVAGGTGWWAWNSINSSTTPQVPAANESPLASPSPNAIVRTAEKSVQIYWLKSVGNRIEPVASPVSVKDTGKPEELLEDAFKRLLAGQPPDPEMSSTIPEGTKLRKVDVKPDGVHVDLSQEFTTGGGSSSMSGRVAQVLYTATSLNPNANVWIEVEGKQLDVLGGEGLVLDQPLTRKNFEQNFDL